MKTKTTVLLKCVCLLLAGIACLTTAAVAGPPLKGGGNWPDLIPLDVSGFEPEGIERGKGHEFFVGAFSFSNFFGAPLSDMAGAIYKGNLRTGEGGILVEPTGRPVVGLSYDPRTDYLYAATGFAVSLAGPYFDYGVVVYDATTGHLVTEIIIGDGILLNDVLVTRRGVYCTDSANPALYEILLEEGGRLPAQPVVEQVTLSEEFVMVEGLNCNGLVGHFDGAQLIVVNRTSGVLYLVDTATGDAEDIAIDGDEQLFVNGDGLYLEGRTLYICQNFSNKVAVVQLDGDLRTGTFVKNLPDPEGLLSVPTTITGFGDSIYAINTNFFDLLADPKNFRTEVVKLPKH